MRAGARGNAPRLAIVGGGFGGLCAAQALGSAPLSVTLVDRENHHLFQPLLYQVAPLRWGRRWGCPPRPVEPDLSLPGHPEVFVVGDLAWFAHGLPTALPAVAPVAMQQGRFAAQAIRASLEGRPRGRFRYRDRGSMATIRRGAAIAQVGRLRLAGYLAWLL